MKKYNIIYADPPWTYNDWNKRQNLKDEFLGVSSSKKRSPSRHYKTMSIEDIKNLPISKISEDDCLLFLWVLPHMLKEGIETLESWGFNYKTIAFTWVKRNKISNSWFWGMGGWTRSNAELCLLGTKGVPKRVSKSIHQVCDARITKHSEKPDEIRDKIVSLCGNLSRIELFARKQVEGWDVFGDEVENTIDLLGLKKELVI